MGRLGCSRYVLVDSGLAGSEGCTAPRGVGINIDFRLSTYLKVSIFILFYFFFATPSSLLDESNN